MSAGARLARDDSSTRWALAAKPIDLWELWVFAETEAALMLHAWSTAAIADKASAHAGYRAALEREEQAARVLAARLARAAAREPR
ncbi:MAG: hypothetical protein QOD69_2661 [Solirubrobacteraceae bacterium]|nr:hypothetical protein [Solirubrobacteraceae bacterium]